jgi:hypothetical protein
MRCNIDVSCKSSYWLPLRVWLDSIYPSFVFFRLLACGQGAALWRDVTQRWQTKPSGLQEERNGSYKIQKDLTDFRQLFSGQMNGRFYKTTKGWGLGGGGVDERRGITEPVSTYSIDREILCWAFPQEIYSELPCNLYGTAQDDQKNFTLWTVELSAIHRPYF